MALDSMIVQRFQVELEGSPHIIEAVCVECGADLVVIVGGGSRYHCGAVALSISLPGLKDPQKLTNSTYQVPVPGHKEEALAREGSLVLSRALQRNVVVSVGIHEDNLPKERVSYYVEQYYALIDRISQAYQPNP